MVKIRHYFCISVHSQRTDQGYQPKFNGDARILREVAAAIQFLELQAFNVLKEAIFG